jgi:hypothetical protein
MSKNNLYKIEKAIRSKCSVLTEASYRLEAMKNLGPLKFLDLATEETYIANLELELIGLYCARNRILQKRQSNSQPTPKGKLANS